MRYVESQNLRVIKSNVITLYNSLDCYWMCKKIRSTTIYVVFPDGISMSLYHLKERAGGKQVCWVRGCSTRVLETLSAHTARLWSGVSLEAFYNDQVPPCARSVHHGLLLPCATQHSEPESQCVEPGEHRNFTELLKQRTLLKLQEKRMVVMAALPFPLHKGKQRLLSLWLRGDTIKNCKWLIEGYYSRFYSA